MSIHPIHRPDAAYGQPEVHIPYPAEPLNYPPYLNNPDDDPDRESLTGEIKGDETSAEEQAMPEAMFSNFVLDKIGIGPNRENRAHVELLLETERTKVLLPIPRSAAEEKELHEAVMVSLRKRVEALEEEELFESSMRHFTQRSSMVMVGDATTAGLVMASGNPATVMGEPNAAGLGDQPRSRDVRELLRADVQEIWARERERARRAREVPPPQEEEQERLQEG